jgi:6-pyruvoyltetrahydropterin/6-carboxytetrahydropterin synthase
MYHVRIREHIMIAHSLKDKFFGPAQKKHGATYVVDVTFYADKLNAVNVVIDIGLAHQVLKEVLAPLNYIDLDDIPEFENKLTTTEFLAKHIHDRVKDAVKNEFSGSLEVVLGESHVAWAGYKGG